MRWPRNIKEAKRLQFKIRQNVKVIPLKKEPQFIAGVDAAFFKDKVIGTVCLYKYPELTYLEDNFAVARVSFPYIPGFLSFREGPY